MSGQKDENENGHRRDTCLTAKKMSRLASHNMNELIFRTSLKSVWVRIERMVGFAEVSTH